MATFNLVITYPDGQGPRIIDALKAHYSVATNAEAQEAFRLQVTQLLKTIVLHEERKAATAPLTPPDAT